MRLRPLLLNSAALALGLLLALALVEAGVRLTGATAPGGVAIATERSFARVPGIYEPGQDELDRRIQALPFRVRINSLGYRGPDFPLRKPDGEIRVLMAGDSLTFGDFVEDDETLPARVQVQLDCPHPTVVVNAGMGGSSIATQSHLIERGLVLEPDLVVLTFYENDIADLESPHWDLVAKNRTAKSRFPLSAIYPVIRKLASWRLLQEALAGWRNRSRVDGEPGTQGLGDAGAAQRRARHEKLRAEYASRLVDLADDLRRQGVPFLLATYPSHLTLQSAVRSDDLDWIEDFGRVNGIGVVSLWDPLFAARRPPEDLYLLPHDGHPTPLAYGIAAAHLAGAIRRGPLRDRCGNF